MKNRIALSLGSLLLGMHVFAQAVTPPSTTTHRWFPYRPIDPRPASPAKLIGVQVVEEGGFILTFDQEIDPVCTAGTAGNASLPKTRLYFLVNNDAETSAAAVKAALATALSALHGGGQIHVMYNFTSSLCLGRFIAITK